MRKRTDSLDSRRPLKKSRDCISRGSRGFSTFEVVTVVMIGMVAATMVAPAIYDSVLRYRLVTAANALASELNAARVLSISSGSAHTISFDPQSRLLQVIDSAGTGDPARCARIESGISIHMPQQSIRFSSRGIASGGSLQLVNSNGDVVVVEITSTGRTRVGRLRREGTS